VNYSPEQLRRRAHLTSGGSLANYNRQHYKKEHMIPVKLTTVNGSVADMPFASKEKILEFIDQYSSALPIGTAVNIDAPLVGIHSGWIQGRKATANA
jgi:hypothetical protein